MIPGLSNWRRSKRGNLWQKLPDGRLATVFFQDGWYKWCLSDEDEDPRFSPRRFDTEEGAIEDLLYFIDDFED